MKKTLATAALALASLLAAPNKAEAGHDGRTGLSNESNCRTFVCGRGSCGCPTYTRRIFRGYDRCGRPIFRFVRVPFRCSGACKSGAVVPRLRIGVDLPGWHRRPQGDRRARAFRPRHRSPSLDCSSGRCPL